MARLIDLTGKKFYEWTVIEKAKAGKRGQTRWLCECSCGKTGIVGSYDLRKGRHKSCGHDRKTTLKDIKGRVFGELTVLEYVGDSKWKCRCSCGEIREVGGYDLTTGRTKSCGHNTTGFKNIKGQKFGEWEVLEYVGNHLWKCRCSCGKISDIHSYSLRSGGSKSCGHNRESKKLEDLTGQTFNDWSVLEYVGDSKWKCKCSCGNVSIVAAYDLKQGNSRNCGHNRKKPYTDLTGMKFGEITVVEYLYKNKYLCECSCGEQREILGSNLLSGGTRSCGCKSKSEFTEEVLRSTIMEHWKKNGSAPFIPDLATMLGITPYYVNSLLNKYNLKELMNIVFDSRYERDIYDIIKGVDERIQVYVKKRGLIPENKEIDLYIPSRNLAVEINGDYWHSDERLEIKYHQNKTLECAKAGIQLIHVFEYEWIDDTTRRKITKLIESKIDNSELRRVYARNCQVKAVGKEEERNFLNNYHLQNYTNSKEAYGLYLGDTLVSIMTFGRPRFNADEEWELIRYCNRDDVLVVGGAERLFKHFIKRNDVTSMITYCDIAKFNGNIYTKLGFKAGVTDITRPNYKWVKQSYEGREVLSRYQTQKDRLLKMGLGRYGDTEDEIMRNMGYMKIYDSGNLRLKWNIH